MRWPSYFKHYVSIGKTMLIWHWGIRWGSGAWPDEPLDIPAGPGKVETVRPGAIFLWWRFGPIEVRRFLI